MIFQIVTGWIRESEKQDKKQYADHIRSGTTDTEECSGEYPAGALYQNWFIACKHIAPAGLSKFYSSQEPSGIQKLFGGEYGDINGVCPIYPSSHFGQIERRIFSDFSNSGFRVRTEKNVPFFQFCPE